MPTELVEKLPSSSLHLFIIFLSHSEPASLTHLHLFTTKQKLSFPFSLFHTFLHALSSSCLPHPRPPSSPLLPQHHPSLPSFTDDLGSHSLSLPFMKLLVLFPASRSPSLSLSPISLTECSLPGPRLLKSSCIKNTGTPKMISRG